MSGPRLISATVIIQVWVEFPGDTFRARVVVGPDLPCSGSRSIAVSSPDAVLIELAKVLERFVRDDGTQGTPEEGGASGAG